MTFHCAKCKYDLAGLPPRGDCPECGSRYDVRARVGIDRGESSSTRGDRIFRRVTAGILVVLAIVLVALGFYFKFAHQRENALGVSGFVAFALLLCAGIAIMGEKED